MNSTLNINKENENILRKLEVTPIRDVTFEYLIILSKYNT